MPTPKTGKILIGTPMYGGMCTGTYCFSIINTVSTLINNGSKVAMGIIYNESLITRARNELARLCLADDFTHLMFIDADVGFPAEAVNVLLDADKDIACGMYPKKEIDWSKIKEAAKNDEENLHDFGGIFVLNATDVTNPVTDTTGMVEVRHGGTGFMLIKRKVLEDLIPHVPTYKASGVDGSPLVHEFFATSIDQHGVLLSEDYHFCELWRKHGGKIHATPFIKLNHMGSYIYTGDVLKAGANIK